MGQASKVRSILIAGMLAAPLAAVGLEVLHSNSDGHAGLATVAMRSVGEES